MKDEKRVVKGYKIKHSTYLKAMKRAKVTPLATLIEEFVTGLANCATITIETKSTTTVIKGKC